MLRKIENLVFSGGGQRTLYAIPVLEYFEKAGVLHDLKRIAASSAGNTPALALALGYNVEQMIALLKKYGFNGGTNRNFNFIPEHLASHSSPYYQIEKGDDYLLQTGKCLTNTGIYCYLLGKSIVNMFLNQGLLDTSGFEEAYWYIIKDSPNLAHLSDEEKRKLTFGQLHDLKIQFPDKKFVDLYVTTSEEVKKNEYKLHLCSFETTHDMPILEAVVASSHLRTIFRKRQYGDKVLWDGGYVKNTARDLFDSPSYFNPDDRLTNKMNMRTVAIYFAKSQKEIEVKRDNISHKSRSLGLIDRIRNALTRQFYSWIAPLNQLEKQNIEDQQGANALRTLYLDAGDFGLVTADLTEESYKKMRNYAMKEAEQFVNNYIANVLDPHCSLKEIKQATNSTELWKYFYQSEEELKTYRTMIQEEERSSAATKVISTLQTIPASIISEKQSITVMPSCF